MDTSPNKDLEVTGVSRSGRVRKKSSKLTDFQSLDGIEAARALKKISHPRPHKMSHLHTTSNDMTLPPIISSQIIENLISPVAISIKLSADLDSDKDESQPQPTLSVLNVQRIDSNDEPSLHEEEDSLMIDTTVRRSAYMTEKNPKKKMRKDKGKSRYTAYIMWSKEVRQQMLKSNPEMDFSTMSRRLGEMWANVPGNEKFNWRRRAKRIAIKMDRTAESIEKSGNTKMSKSKFLNRKSASTRKKCDKKERTSTMTASATSRSKHSANKNGPTVNITPGPYKVTGMAVIDVAAHLKLLGDSLSVIGQRLKEHEGQITVSGSMSVLLDSLLCSLGPLMCLTNLIPGIDEPAGHLEEMLRSTLDNIAYVMPGVLE